MKDAGFGEFSMRLVLAWALGTLASTGFAAVTLGANVDATHRPEFVVQSVYSQADGFAPKIKTLGPYVILTHQRERELGVYKQLSSGSVPELQYTLPTSWGQIDLATHSSGWVALCYELGSRVLAFRLQNPTDRIQLRFPDGNDIHCTGLAIDEQLRSDGRPRFWLGVTGTRRIRLFDPILGRSLRTFEGVSGPFHLQHFQNKVFTLNELTDPGAGLPLVLDARSGRALVGHPMGDLSQTRLKREYSHDIFVDRVSSSVYYISTRTSTLLRVPTQNTSESALEFIASRVPLGKEVRRLGQCLVVFGTTPLPERLPVLEILKPDSDSKMQSLGLTGGIGSGQLHGAYHFAVLDSGEAVVSHWTGVSSLGNLYGSYPECL
jgi:hypothetical protein